MLEETLQARRRGRKWGRRRFKAVVSDDAAQHRFQPKQATEVLGSRLNNNKQSRALRCKPSTNKNNTRHLAVWNSERIRHGLVALSETLASLRPPLLQCTLPTRLNQPPPPLYTLLFTIPTVLRSTSLVPTML
jgi:hypothetical protein